jgi:hypothetical protein
MFVLHYFRFVAIPTQSPQLFFGGMGAKSCGPYKVHKLGDRSIPCITQDGLAYICHAWSGYSCIINVVHLKAIPVPFKTIFEWVSSWFMTVSFLHNLFCMIWRFTGLRDLHWEDVGNRRYDLTLEIALWVALLLEKTHGAGKYRCRNWEWEDSFIPVVDLSSTVSGVSLQLIVCKSYCNIHYISSKSIRDLIDGCYACMRSLTMVCQTNLMDIGHKWTAQFNSRKWITIIPNYI